MSPLDPVDARALHAEVPVIDLHADTPKLMSELGYDIMSRHERRLPTRLNYAGHLDVPRMREGGLGAQIFGMWTVPYPQRGCAAGIHKQLDALDAAIEAHPDAMARCASRGDIEAAHAAGKIACLTGIEGAQALEGDIGHIEVFARRAVRYVGLMHFTKNPFGYPAKGLGADADKGLTELGRAAVAELDRCGVVLDLAHINRAGFFDALEVSTRPMMVTHTGIAGVHEHWRNIDDEQIRAVADRGGCVGVIFARRFLGGRDIDAVCDHLLHIIDVAGEDVPALGSDFDGFVIPPVGLEDVTGLPRLTAALSRRGLSNQALKKLLSGNALRVLGEVEPTAFLSRESRVER